MPTLIKRLLQPVLESAAAAYPIVTVTGPRQSGKTTLVRAVFGQHAYSNLELPDERAFALEDPRGFLGQFEDGVILDEVQRVPELLSYIQAFSDEAPGRMGRYVLTGSQNLLLLERVSQSLAGRTAVHHLLPFSQSELLGRKPLPLQDLGTRIPKRAAPNENAFDRLWRGFYPRIHAYGLDPRDWYRNYYMTYIERDVRTLSQVGDVETFSRFVRLCAGRCGQLLNLSSLGADCGVSHTTAKRWLSVLEASFIVYLLRPYHRNFNKRITKSPKLYILDTGLLSYLLGIREPDELVTHPLRGAVFEAFVLAELIKACHNLGREPRVYFWRDAAGREIDFLLVDGPHLIPIEAKSGETIASDFFDGFDFWRTLPGQAAAPAALVYGGETSTARTKAAVYAWHDWL